MDKKKLIGTIIGVAMFAALIAGATFAFLTFTANVTNATYNGTTMNFLVDYTKGSVIEEIPQLASGTTTDITKILPSQAASLVVVAKHHEGSAEGYTSIKLTTTSTGTLTTGSLVNWVICRDPNVEAGTQVDNVCGSSFANATNSGVISATGTIALLSDAALAMGTSKITPESTSTRKEEYLLYNDNGTHTDYSYFVYFWINSTNINNTHIGQQYSGHIHASATQIIE